MFDKTATMKFAHNLVAVTFGAGCVGLSMVMQHLLMLQRAHPFPPIGDRYALAPSEGGRAGSLSLGV